jgi:hypothetical protein
MRLPGEKPYFIRVRASEGTKWVYAAEEEISCMERLWGLPASIIEQSYFSIKDTQANILRGG